MRTNVLLQGSAHSALKLCLDVPATDGKFWCYRTARMGFVPLRRFIPGQFSVIDKGDSAPRGEDVSAAIAADLAITHVMAIHCETFRYPEPTCRNRQRRKQLVGNCWSTACQHLAH